MFRSILSILAGAIVWDVLYLGSNAVLVAALPTAFREDGSTDNIGILWFSLALSVVFYVIAGYVTASIAPAHKLKNALALGLFQLPQGIYAQIQYWEVLPLWFHLTFLILLIPGILLGAKIRLAKHKFRPLKPIEGLR